MWGWGPQGMGRGEAVQEEPRVVSPPWEPLRGAWGEIWGVYAAWSPSGG